MTNLPVPVPAQETPGNLITGALWNANVYNGLSFLLGKPVFVGYQTTAQSMPSGQWTSVTIDTETLDSYGGHSNTTNPSRYIPQVPGTYLVLATACFAGNATSSRRVRVALNGNQVIGAFQSTLAEVASNVTSTSTAGFVVCNGTTDYIECQGEQNSGVTLNTSGSGSSLSVLWISK